ncbi:hypothetical protein NL676_024705 [Syzygium grande]|nr:hypothetical protein NL676_024705 [Syzygium grande]
MGSPHPPPPPRIAPESGERASRAPINAEQRRGTAGIELGGDSQQCFWASSSRAEGGGGGGEGGSEKLGSPSLRVAADSDRGERENSLRESRILGIF